MKRATVIYRGMTFNKYEIAEDGKIYRIGSEQPLKPWDDMRGYLKVDLMSDNNIKIGVKIHIAVANTFIGPREEGMIIEHKDGVKHNNNLSNLEYITQRENVARAQVLIKNKEYVDKDKYHKIMKELDSGVSIVELAKKYEINSWIIRDMKIGKTYNHYNN